MKVITVLTRGDGFGENSNNKTKMSLLDNLLDQNGEEASLIVLPAGCFFSKDGKLDKSILSGIKSRAKKFNLSILFGIDSEKKSVRSVFNKERLFELSENNELPFWAVYVSPNSTVLSWQQTSTNTNDAFVGKKYFDANKRIIHVRDRNSAKELRIAVLVCGEIYSKYSRKKVAEIKPDLVVDLGHIGMRRIIPSMKIVARLAKVPVLHCQHVNSIYTSELHCVDAKENKKSVKGRRVVDKKVIAKYAVWEMTNKPSHIKCLKGCR